MAVGLLSGWKTSDRPVFATYDKRNSKNIRFRISMPGGYSAMLDSVGYCEARYTPGRRSYHLTDPAWGKGELRISALALPDVDGAIWKLEPVGFLFSVGAYGRYVGDQGTPSES